MNDFRVDWFDSDSECRVAFPRLPFNSCFSYFPELNLMAWKYAKSEFYKANPRLQSVELFLVCGDAFVSGVSRTGFYRRHKQKIGRSKVK